MVKAALLALAVPLVASAVWRPNPPLPLARSEVAAAPSGTGVAVVGGFLADGSSSARVDFYRTPSRTWDRLPDLPAAVNHSTAADLIKLDQNENPNPPSERVTRAVMEALTRGNRYPRNLQDLLDALAKAHGVVRENLLVAAGSGELLRSLKCSPSTHCTRAASSRCRSSVVW